MPPSYKAQSKLTTVQIANIHSEINVIDSDIKTKINTTQVNTVSSKFSEFLTHLFQTFKIFRENPDGTKYEMQASDYTVFYNELDNTFDITSDYAKSYTGAMTHQFQAELLALQTTLNTAIQSQNTSLTSLINAVQETSANTVNSSISSSITQLNATITALQNKSIPVSIGSVKVNEPNLNNLKSLPIPFFKVNTGYVYDNSFKYDAQENILCVSAISSGVISSGVISSGEYLVVKGVDIGTAVSALQTNQAADESNITTLLNWTANPPAPSIINATISDSNGDPFIDFDPCGNRYPCSLYVHKPTGNMQDTQNVSLIANKSVGRLFNYSIDQSMLFVPKIQLADIGNVGASVSALQSQTGVISTNVSALQSQTGVISTNVSALQTKQTADETSIATLQSQVSSIPTISSSVATLQTQVAPYITGLNPYLNSQNFMGINNGFVAFNDTTTNFKYLKSLGATKIYVKLIGAGGGGGTYSPPYRAGSGGGAGGYYEGLIDITGLTLSGVQVGIGGAGGNNGGSTYIEVIKTGSYYPMITAGGGISGTIQPDNVQYGVGGAGGTITNLLTTYASSHTDIVSSSGNDGGSTMSVSLPNQEYPTAGQGGSGYFGSLGAGGKGLDPLTGNTARSTGKNGYALIMW